ncbi:hypothetical protein BH11MYX2_BH11MYX2_27010 [soil metagenome]
MKDCPSEEALDIAISVGADSDLEAHLAACDRCRTLWDDTIVLLGLARHLPAHVPGSIEAEERRTAILAAWDLAPTPRPVVPVRARRRVLHAATLALAAAAAVAVTWFATRPPSAPTVVVHPRRGVVHAHEHAVFALASQPPDEIVRLRDGVIDVDVDPLQAGERFRVIVGIDEIEVHGTSFEVVALADRLVSVRVVHGRVEVRHAGDKPVFLGPSEGWHVTVASVAAPPSATASLAPSPVHSKSLHASPAGSAAPTASPQETVFVRGWEQMRQGSYEQALGSFDRALVLSPDGALAQDATFWRVVALARLHRSVDAITAFRSFIDTFPASTRVGEASAMLGWLLIDANELDEARRLFHAAEHDTNAAARDSAVQGLAALDGMKRR